MAGWRVAMHAPSGARRAGGISGRARGGPARRELMIGMAGLLRTMIAPLLLVGASITRSDTTGGTVAASSAATSLAINISVDARAKGVVLTGAPNGFLHALTATSPPPGLLTPLSPKSYRGSPHLVVDRSGGNYARLVGLGVRHIQIVLSDQVGYPPASASWPGDNGNFSHLDATIEDLIQATSSGMEDVEWDVWNEPNGPPHQFWQRGITQFLDLWTHAVSKIKAMRPTATIVGPSPDFFDEIFLRRFLAHANTTGTLPDVLSWHELDPGEGCCHSQDRISLIEANAKAAKQLALRYGVKRFSVNEIVPEDANTPPNPARHVNFLAALSRAANIESAMHSCWADARCGGSACRPGMLDGLLGCTGECGECSADKRRATWYVYQYFASQIDGITLPIVVNHGDRVDGIATIDNTGVVRMCACL